MIEKLTVISILTATITEAIKKVLDETNIKYATNIVAVIVSTVISTVVELYPLVTSEIKVDPTYLCELVSLVFLSFIGATLGYDKVVQMVKQIQGE